MRTVGFILVFGDSKKYTMLKFFENFSKYYHFNAKKNWEPLREKDISCLLSPERLQFSLRIYCTVLI